jgi:N-acetylneuraminic acid mutarotase
MVVGGENSTGYTSSAELYNPATGTWTATGSLLVARYGFPATSLHNGQVLVAGGNAATGGLLAEAEVYTPATGKWAVTGSLDSARAVFTQTLLPSGQVLAAAGNDGISPGGYAATAELYNPATGSWAFTGRLSTGRMGQTATLLTNGNVLVADGLGATGLLTSAELYHPATGAWTTTGSTRRTGNYATALLQNGQVLTIGGGTLANGAELYTP